MHKLSHIMRFLFKQLVNKMSLHLWWPEADRIAINDAQRTIEVNGKMGGKSEVWGSWTWMDKDYRHFYILTWWEEKHQSDAFFEPHRNTHPHVLSLPLRKNTCLVEWCSPLAPASLPLVSLVGSESQALQEKLRRLEAQPRGRPKWPSWDPEILEFDNHFSKYHQISKSKGIWHTNCPQKNCWWITLQDCKIFLNFRPAAKVVQWVDWESVLDILAPKERYCARTIKTVGMVGVLWLQLGSNLQ